MTAPTTPERTVELLSGLEDGDLAGWAQPDAAALIRELQAEVARVRACNAMGDTALVAWKARAEKAEARLAEIYAMPATGWQMRYVDAEQGSSEWSNCREQDVPYLQAKGRETRELIARPAKEES